MTALIRACEGNHFEVVAGLISAKANLDLCDNVNR
jgi:hypothetical protein